jgi:hypothetical protein
MRSRLRSGSLLVLAILLAGPGAHAAGKPSCECKWRACVESTIEQKKDLVQVYERLASEWAKKQRKDLGQFYERPESDGVIDLEKLPLEKRQQALAALRATQAAFGQDEEKATIGVGAPAGCGLPPGVELGMATDTVGCRIDHVAADRVRKLLPCRELGDFAYQHETFHLARCNERKGDRAIPAKLQTPAGKAREEIEAYSQEIAKLETLLADATIELSGRMLVRSEHGGVSIWTQGKIPLTIDEQGRIRGTAEQLIEATPSPLKCSIELAQSEVRYDVGGTRSGKKLRISLFSPPPVVRATFRCPEGEGHGQMPYPFLVRLEIENKNKAEVTQDLAKLSNGAAQGKITFTLRLCAKKRR